MARFQRYVGVHYAGRKGPEERLRQIRVFVALEDSSPYQAYNEADSDGGRWSRRELATWLLALLGEADVPTALGIDHAFSFPLTYLQRNHLTNWDQFLYDFEANVPTQEVSVRDLLPGNQRTGDPDEHRLTGDWTAFPKSVFSFDLQDSPARAAYAGLPWLAYLRRSGDHVHFWPFDGFEVPEGASVVAETRPHRLRHRYSKEGLSDEDLDAYCVCAWLQDRDRLGLLSPYFAPPLSDEEKVRAKLEGWILGVS